MTRREFLALVLAFVAAPGLALRTLEDPGVYWVLGVSLLGVDTILAPGDLPTPTPTYTPSLTPTATATATATATDTPTATSVPPRRLYFPIVEN